MEVTFFYVMILLEQWTDNLRNLLQPVFVNVIKSAISFAVNINDGNHVVTFERGHYHL